MKSLLVNVFWPAWEWSALGRPNLRYLSFSYSSDLTERDNEKLMFLLKSKKFTDMWGKVFHLSKQGVQKFSNNKRGWKLASSVQGVGTGERGDRVLVDDAHNVRDGESKRVTASTVRWFRESISDRLNDMDKSAIIVIMQRVSRGDISGEILDNDFGYVHLCIPAEFESFRRCETEIGWSDPRTYDGEPYWPARLSPNAMSETRKIKGNFAWDSQYQQRPNVRGGEIISSDYWNEYDPRIHGRLECDYIVASLDPAFTSKTENDPSGLTVWGAFSNNKGERCAIMLYAFRKHLELHGPYQERWAGETDDDYRARCKDSWGLVEHVADVCKRFNVDNLLIEAKASGHSVAQEMRRLYSHDRFSVELIDPKSLDKLARLNRVQPMFADGQIYVPLTKVRPRPGDAYDPENAEYRIPSWAEMVMVEVEEFPHGKHDDLCDSLSQGLWYLRQMGFMTRREDQFASKSEAERKYKIEQPLYPV
jgi:hypothetical protein